MPNDATPPDTPEKPAVPGLRLLKLVGKGASGEVWTCRNETDTSFSAVKIVRRGTRPEKVWYRHELKALRKYARIRRKPDSLLDIKHVAVSEDKTFLYYTTPVADGVKGLDPSSTRYQPLTLKSLLADGNPIPPVSAAEIAARIAEALQTLHEHGLLHRDVKPDNIIFCEGRAVLADIGLVTETEQDVSLAGTPRYMEPGQTPSARTDLYALGKVLYEMVNGKDPECFPDLASLQESGDTGTFQLLNNIWMRACGEESERYGKASQMLADLRRVTIADRAQGDVNLWPSSGAAIYRDPKQAQKMLESLPEPERRLASDGYRLDELVWDGNPRVWTLVSSDGPCRCLSVSEISGPDAADRLQTLLGRISDLALTNDSFVEIGDVRADRTAGFVSFSFQTGKEPEPYTLEDEIRTRGRMPAAECAAVGLRLLGALKALRNKMIPVHDVGPENVLRVDGAWRLLAGTNLISDDAAEVERTYQADNPGDKLVMAEEQRIAAFLLYRMATGNPVERFPQNAERDNDRQFARLRRVYELAGAGCPDGQFASLASMEVALTRIIRSEGQQHQPRRRAKAALPWVTLLSSSPPESPHMERFRQSACGIISDRHPELPGPDGGRGSTTPQEIAVTADELRRFFERRIGFVPDNLMEAGSAAERMVDPAAVERRHKWAFAICACLSLIGTILLLYLSVRYLMSWPDGFWAKVWKAVIIFVFGIPVAVGGSIFAIRIFAFVLGASDDVEAHRRAQGERAIATLLAGVGKAIDEIWSEYRDSLDESVQLG